MANPNMASATDIYGMNVTTQLTTAWITFITCASNKVCRINSIIVSNIDGTNACDVNIQVNSINIVTTVSVPADSSLVVVSKDTGLYLTEGQLLRAYASANSDLQMVVSYEVIS